MMKTIAIHRIQALIFIFIAFNAFATEHNFSIRDSHTGVSINAQVTAFVIDKEQIPNDIWRGINHKIKMGHSIPSQYNSSSFELSKTSSKYQLESSNFLQYIQVKAAGYQTLRTHISPSSNIKLTSMMLDKINSDNNKRDSTCRLDTICGHVYDKNSLEPLENVAINLFSKHKHSQHLTDSSGYFEFKQSVSKNSQLTISLKGYKSHWYINIPESAQFNMIIDLEQGYGVKEQSMKHPLNDVFNDQVNKQWLDAKLSHTASTAPKYEPEQLRERTTEAVYLEPPTSIRVGFNSSGGTCCGHGCSTSEVYSLETYVQRGLDDEWIASWQADSLKAGSIPFRSYGAWHVLNGPYSGYDICAGPCCQAFDFTGHAASMTAAEATNGIMLDRNGEIARSEYSAQNNSWDDPNDGLNCSNADLTCGDGSVGSPDTGWSCLLDTVSSGRGCYGHGRGMSQWGTQYHAQDGDSFADIVDHYYNASNNPSGQRNQYASTPIRLDAIDSSSQSVSANEVFSIDYELFNAANDSVPFGPILLGASLVSLDNSYSDPTNDHSVSLTTSGAETIQRMFQVSSNAVPGDYELVTAVYLDVDTDNNISAADWKLVTVTDPNLITVLHEDDLIFKDGFSN